jgi:hypothetical protein
MKTTMIFSIVLTLAAATPALATADHHRHSHETAVSQTDPGYQPSPYRNEVPWAPF